MSKGPTFIEQYLQTKEQYNDCIIFFRMGDFYEMFFDDAVTISHELDLTLTQKSYENGKYAPMCGVPYHACQTYIARILEHGHKIAICEQMSEPKPGKLVERQVVKIISPGTVTDSELLDESKNNFLMSIYKNGNKMGVCYVDITTGDFNAMYVTDDFENQLSNVLSRVLPSEVLCNVEAKGLYDDLPIMRLGYLPKATEYYEWAYSEQRADANLQKQFGENYAKVFELSNKKAIICAAGAIIEYIQETQKKLIKNLNNIKLVKSDKYLIIDMNTRRNLELVENVRDRKNFGSLLWLMNKTKTRMGARKLRNYFDEPLQESREINQRLDCIEEFVKKLIMRDRMAEALHDFGDIERISGKIACGNVHPKDMITLKNSLKLLPEIKEILANATSPKLIALREEILDFSSLIELLEKAIEPNVPTTLKDGGYIRDGFNTELDDYRHAKEKGKSWIKDLENKEKEATGIKNLKIDSNRVFGYFIEINKQFANQVPLRYTRKQTVANNERYITDDLKEIESKIFGSEEKALKLESLLLNKIRETLQDYVKPLQQVSSAIAQIDVFLSGAIAAVTYNLVRPTINSSVKDIKIIDGRHPVVERFAKSGSFIPNDTYLNDSTDRIMIITGPNMAGKSTYMRQVAIITFLAHIGSFVPAKEAQISITDRIFTRVGASDDLIFGQSTFMVEMSEVATILANATDKSLIILDEIGRGTSTFDGLSIAWSVVEYLSNNLKAKTLFATHYHELTELEGVIEGVKNYKVAVKEIDDHIVFLRKILRGGANKSFGIEVARLAGLPDDVLSRAKEISINLERVNTKLDLDVFKENKDKASLNTKKALAILTRLKDVDMNRLSPMSAFDLLNDLTNQAKEEK